MSESQTAGVRVVGAREPCPCGSGRRYKACHGRDGHTRTQQRVARPFAGLAGECDWVAFREILPAATATLRVRKNHHTTDAARAVTLATVLPLAWPAMVRLDGSIYVGAQSLTASLDPSRDLAAILLDALAAPPGTPITSVPAAADAVGAAALRLQDVLEPAPLDVKVHSGFEFWGNDMPDPDGELAASLERASDALVPTQRLTSVDAAYWCRMGARTHLRWVLPDDEDALLDALARLHAARELSLGDGSRYVGAFRAHGLLVPVWDLAADATADDAEGPAAALRKQLDALLAAPTPLTPQERRSRAGLLSRQVTLR